MVGQQPPGAALMLNSCYAGASESPLSNKSRRMSGAWFTEVGTVLVGMIFIVQVAQMTISITKYGCLYYLRPNCLGSLALEPFEISEVGCEA
jgi:hypothetical protein